MTTPPPTSVQLGFFVVAIKGGLQKSEYLMTSAKYHDLNHFPLICWVDVSSVFFAEKKIGEKEEIRQAVEKSKDKGGK